MKSILLLGAGVGSPDVVARLKSLGLRIILVELRHLYDAKKAAPADEVILTDYRSAAFQEHAAQLRQLWWFDVVVSITEAGGAVAAALNRRFGVRGSDERSIGYLNNKASMRALLHEHGFGTVEYELLEQRSQVAAFAARAGLPLILKPLDAGGSQGIHKVSTVAEAEAAFDRLTAQQFKVLAEQYIDGKEYSVEAFTCDGRHSIYAITEKVVNESFVEIGHLVPAMLPPAVAEDVRQFVERFLSIVGVTHGPSHTELKISSKGLKIIESHNRIGGGNITKLVLLVYGVDLIKLTGQWASQLIDAPPAQQPANGAAAVHFFVFPPGKITALHGLDEVARNPTTVEYACIHRTGDTVPATLDNSGRSGFVIVQDTTAEAALHTVQRLARGVVAVTSPAVGAA